MKYETLINSALALVVIIAAIMRIQHVEYASTVLIFGLLATNLFQSWVIRTLKKKAEKI